MQSNITAMLLSASQASRTVKSFPSIFVNITGARCDSSNMLAFLDRTLVEHGNPGACAPKNCPLPAGMAKVVHPEALFVDLSLDLAQYRKQGLFRVRELLVKKDSGLGFGTSKKMIWGVYHDITL